MAISCSEGGWYTYNPTQTPNQQEGTLVWVYSTTVGQAIDVTPLGLTPVSGVSWSIQSGSYVYMSGGIVNGRMVGLPSVLYANASSVEVWVWTANPFPDGISPYTYYSYYP
jgi:hypothetical protein